MRALGAGMHGLRPQGDAEAGRQAQARAGARAGPQQGVLCAQLGPRRPKSPHLAHEEAAKLLGGKPGLSLSS